MLDANTAILIGVIIFFLCGTYLLTKYIKIANETQIELKRIENGVEKEKARYNSYTDQVLNGFSTIPFYKSEPVQVNQDTDPTMMFAAVSDNTQRRYIAEDTNNASKTTKMPKVEVEKNDDNDDR